MTGRPLSSWQAGKGAPAVSGDVIPLVVTPADRAVLHERIAQRFDAMLSEGFLDEVAALHRRGDLGTDLPSVRAVGYRQLWAHLDGEMDLEQAKQAAVAATRQLAKRQFTGLRRWPDAVWLSTGLGSEIVDVQTPLGDRWGELAAAIAETVTEHEQMISRAKATISRQISEILRNFLAKQEH